MGMPKDQRSILLVEDDPDDTELTVHALQKHAGIDEVVVKHDGVDAIDYLLAQGPYAGRDPQLLPRLVLLDLKLPRLDGLEVLRRLRAEPRTAMLPVVVLTSSREEKDIVESYRCGANSYIRKPVDFDRFIEAVRQVEQYWLSLNEAPPLGR
jgi:two-component system response regulator